MSKLKNIFIPHAKNQYRPHLIRRSGLASLIVLVLAVNIWNNYATAGKWQILGLATNISNTVLLDLTNRDRADEELPELKLNTRLSRAAAAKAKDMLKQNYWSHFAPNGTTPWDFMNKAGYDYRKAGENLAYGYTTSSEVIKGWMNSTLHRQNMLDNSFTEVGFGQASGAFQSGNFTVVVALYGQPADSEGVIASSSRENPGSTTSTANLSSQSELEVEGAAPPPAEESRTSNLGAVASRQFNPALVVTAVVLLLMASVYVARHVMAMHQILRYKKHRLGAHPLLEASMVYLLVWVFVFGTFGASR